MDPDERGDEHTGSAIDAVSQIGGSRAKEMLEVLEQGRQRLQEESAKQEERKRQVCQLCDSSGHTGTYIIPSLLSVCC